MVSGMASSGPAWLASIDDRLGVFLSGNGQVMSAVLAVVLAAVAVGVFLPPPAARAALVLAVAAAAFLWIAEGLGGILTGGGTDPNSGPLLALVAAAYWPYRPQLAPASGPHPQEGP
jgi:hypothetical protein